MDNKFTKRLQAIHQLGEMARQIKMLGDFSNSEMVEVLVSFTAATAALLKMPIKELHEMTEEKYKEYEIEGLGNVQENPGSIN